MNFRSEVTDINFYTDSTFSLRFERKGLQFQTGQYIVLSLPEGGESREYSIASGEKDPWLEVLIKAVPEGLFSTLLKNLRPGSKIEVDGPYGFFILKEKEVRTKKYVLVATGTGIAPFESFIRTYPLLNYQLFHGVRFIKENYGKDVFPSANCIICTTGDSEGDFSGRVTACLQEKGIDANKIYYLCGNSHMIDDVADILEEKGVPVRNIRSEVFF